MKLWFTTALAAAMSSMFVPPAHQASQSGASKDEVVIDGSKNPEMFPDWYIWEQLFERMPRNTSRSTNGRPIGDEIGITTKNLDIVRQEVRVFDENKRKLVENARTAKADLKSRGKSEEEIDAASEQLQFEYRRQILAARVRLQQQIPATQFENLVRWNAEYMKGTTLILRGRSAKNFRIPG